MPKQGITRCCVLRKSLNAIIPNAAVQLSGHEHKLATARLSDLGSVFEQVNYAYSPLKEAKQSTRRGDPV